MNDREPRLVEEDFEDDRVDLWDDTAPTDIPPGDMVDSWDDDPHRFDYDQDEDDIDILFDERGRNIMEDFVDDDEDFDLIWEESHPDDDEIKTIYGF